LPFPLPSGTTLQCFKASEFQSPTFVETMKP
jgi:hypothetical protein